MSIGSHPPVARRDLIASRLSRGQPVMAAALAAEFGLSEDAIRRDLRALAAEGRCRRVYGGALPVTVAASPMATRMEEGRERKRRLAAAAIATVQAGELLFLDSSSTNLAVADALPDDADLTVVTNSVDIAAMVLRRQDLRLIVIGGAADPVIGGCVDGAAVQMVTQMRFDRAFVGACSVAADDGVRVFHFGDAIFKRAVFAAARSAVVLATIDKLTERAPHHVAALHDLDALVVESETGLELRAALGSGGCPRLLVADPV